MHVWPVQEVKARFGEFLEACFENGPHIISCRGSEAAVLLPIAQWRTLQAASKPTLKELLLTDIACVDLDILARGHHRLRVPEALS